MINNFSYMSTSEGYTTNWKSPLTVPLTSALKITASPLKGDILVAITIGKRLDAISGVESSIEGYFSPLSIYRVDFLTQ